MKDHQGAGIAARVMLCIACRQVCPASQEHPGDRTISSQEASQHLEELLDDLAGRDEIAIVERNGNPVAVVISVESYRRLTESEADRDWAIIDRLRDQNRMVDPRQAEQDIEDAISEVRRARRRSVSWSRATHA